MAALNRILWPLALFALLSPLSACQPSSNGNNSDDDDSAAGDDDDSTPAPETECLDGLDNDEDGLADCDDSDCDAVEQCTWPLTLSHSAKLVFDANALAEMAGYSDCATEFSSTLTASLDADVACAECDLVFSGEWTYGNDTCPDDPNGPRPTGGSYGISFGGDVSGDWTLYTDDGTGTWSSIGVAIAGDADWNLTRIDPVEVESVEVGSLTTGLTFAE